MAIEKFSGKFTKEDGGCTILINETINYIRNGDAAALYLYLSARPPEWELHVNQLMAHYSWGRDKTYNALTFLQEIKLLKKISCRESGQFIKHEYILTLRPFEPLPDKPEVVTTRTRTRSSPLPDKPDTDKPDTVNQDTYKTKINTKQRSLQNNININTREEKKSDWENHQATYELTRTNQAKEIALSISESEKSFATFWSMYPVKKGEARAKSAWLSQDCHSIANDILQKLDLQLKKDSQYIDGYASNPDKYIMQEKWKDEIQIRKKGKGLDNYDRNAIGWGDKLHEDLF